MRNSIKLYKFKGPKIRHKLTLMVNLVNSSANKSTLLVKKGQPKSTVKSL